ncbi:hypothetical protein IT409_00315, partial [Candidatus Falkowbacteria bacterium]|nr:hypothetical protein [Candidatus Falkowbacteria bacterium]
MIDLSGFDLTETTEGGDAREEFPELINRKMDDYPTELAIADAERVYKDIPKMTLIVNNGKDELTHASVKVSWSFNKETLVQEKIPEYVVVVVGSNLANMMESTHTHRCNRVMFKASDGEGYVRIPKSGTSHVVAFAVTSENIAKKLTSREKNYYEAYINDYYPYGIMSWHTACLCSWAQTTIYAPQTLFAQLPQSGWRKILWDFTYKGRFTLFRKPEDTCN